MIEINNALYLTASETDHQLFLFINGVIPK